jgi:hypothetical protein
MKPYIPFEIEEETTKRKDRSKRLQSSTKRRNKRLSKDELFEQKWK